MTTARTEMVSGQVAEGFESVREAFAANFSRRGELGAAFAVVRDGELVVDLWGGVADEATGRPWERETLQLIFSGTKALVGLCLLMLADRGELDLDAPVCRYWPEFAAEGKGAVRVVDLATHRARLPGVHAPLTEEDLLDGRRMAALLAAQPQEQDPRAVNLYHPLSFGWLCGEVVLRVDGRSVGRFFADEVAEPLGLRLWIGLPDGEGEVSTVRCAPTWGLRRQLYHDVLVRDPLWVDAWENPPLFSPRRLLWNRRDWLRSEIPSGNAVGTARSVARLHGCLARGGELDGIRLLSEAMLERGRRERARWDDPLINEQFVYGIGLQLQNEDRIFGPPAEALGHRGSGGSVHCAWPSERIGISYAMNLLRDDELVDPRAAALLHSVYGAIASQAPR